MNVALHRDEDILSRIRAMFEARGRPMAENNARQADVPQGATVIAQTRGTAPGLICPVGHKVVYAVPGVPYEMTDMMERAVIPDLQRRSGEKSVILSRTLRTWGLAESTLAEQVGPRLEALDRSGGNPTIAFLASGIEGIKVRVTAKAPDLDSARSMLRAEEAELRAIIGDVVFGVDDESMEHAVAHRLVAQGWSLGLAESLTGGLVASRLVNVAGASGWFRGCVVAYDTEVKYRVLGVERGTPAVSRESALAMAEGARRVTGADVGLSITGVAGPEPQDGVEVGTVWMGLALPGNPPEAVSARLPGDRDRIRQFSAISLLDLLRRRLPDPAAAAVGGS
jgi:nicotinamide-nucleotide amidase